MNNILNGIYKCLDIDNRTGLASTDNLQSMTSFQRLFYLQVHEKIGVDAVYFLRDLDGNAKIPLIYFSIVQKNDPQKIAEIHRLAWNLGEAPLLFIVTPDELLIYNNYIAPQKNINGELDPNVAIIEVLSLTEGITSQYASLQKYRRSLLESGEYWRKSKQRFDVHTRVDSTLMLNLRIMRRTLINQISKRTNEKKEKIVSVVHALLSRSIFVKYLEERKDSKGATIFPSDFYSEFMDSAKQYTDILTCKKATYNLFDALKEKFHGDILQVTDYEKDIICQEDLDELRLFILGDSNLESRQLALWPLYSFNIIPIQLISSIYELFFHLSDEDDEKGTYYTPLHLVGLLMDEVFPWEGPYRETTVFDPSCGSGIFLVEAYRRLVCRWIAQNKQAITCEQLGELLSKNIFGVDINEEAIRVASFSLSLTMCDFLDPRSIWDKLSFPNLLGTNLIASDFFAEDKIFNKQQYDIIIGNPPWQSSLTEHTASYLSKSNHIIGDKQIAQAFAIKCSYLCKQGGFICLLMPSKGFLFNRSNRNRMFRKEFFADNNVMAIINFSIYRKMLFEHASGPAAAIIYTPQKNKNMQPIIYCTPKPSFSIEDVRRFSIDPTDICRIPRDIVDDDRIWKIAMWGSPRDLELIGQLQSSFSTMLDYFETNGMSTAEGFKRGNKKRLCNDFEGFPIVDAKNFKPYYVEAKNLSILDFSDFECTVEKNRAIFKAPHLIIKQSHKNGVFLSEVLDYDAVFNHSLLGVHGDLEKLKYLSIIIGSRVFSYYHILTNRRWLVERDELEAGDIWKTPIPTPTNNELMEAEKIFNELLKSSKEKEKAENFVRHMYRLREYENHQIDDVIDYVYDYYRNKNMSISFNYPSIDMYNKYYASLYEVLTNTFGAGIKLRGELYSGEAPLTVLVLYIGENTHEELSIISEEEQVRDLLLKLDDTLVDKRQMVFIRRNLRIYQTDRIYIIKPTQQKYWTYSAAYRDADEIFEDISGVRR